MGDLASKTSADAQNVVDAARAAATKIETDADAKAAAVLETSKKEAAEERQQILDAETQKAQNAATAALNMATQTEVAISDAQASADSTDTTVDAPDTTA